MKHSFSKYKFTNSLFFKKIDIASVELVGDTFNVVAYPHLLYCGTFQIERVIEQKVGVTHYSVFPVDKDGEKIGFNMNIHYYDNGSRFLIFDSERLGIILKN